MSPDSTGQAGEGQTTKGYVHDAFISYSRKDKDFAARLEKTLEDYKPPKDLNVPQRRLEIFRDEVDFTGVEYHQSLDKHLNDSGKLIIICSPNARRSQYVDDEIRRFVQMRGAQNVVSVLVAGIPNNEALPEQSDTMAFPDALCEAMRMPLPADYRNFDAQRHKANRSPYTDAWFKLLADVYGRGISRREVEQRDRKRQTRRRKIAGTMLGAIMTVLVALTAWALVERRTAISQMRISESRRLAAESTSARAEFPQRSGLLAIEALRVPVSENNRAPAAEQALRDVLAVSSGMGLSGHKAEILALAFSLDGRWLVSASADKTARRWDLSAGDLMNSSIELRGHDYPVAAVSISSDSRLLATASGVAGPTVLEEGDYQIRLWDLTSNDVASTSAIFYSHKSPIFSLRISPDRRWLVAGSTEQQVLLWKMSSTLGRHEPLNLTGYTPIFIPDGRWLVTASTGPAIFLWDLSAPDPTRKPTVLRLNHDGSGPNRIISCMTSSPNGRWLVAAGEDGRIHCWDLAAEEPNDTLIVSNKQSLEIRTAAFSPDGHWLVTGRADGTVGVWNFSGYPAEKKPKILNAHQNAAGAIAISPNNRWLVTASPADDESVGEKTAIRWNLGEERPGESRVLLKGHERPIAVVAFSPDSRWLATGSDDATVRLWEMTTADPSTAASAILPDKEHVSSMALTPDRRRLITSEGDQISFWDLDSNGTPRHPMNPAVLQGPEHYYGKVAISPDNHWLVACSGFKDNRVSLWDLTAKDPSRSSVCLHDHKEQLMSVAISPNSRWLATASFENVARLWDLRAKDPSVLPIVLTGHTNYIISAAISSDSAWLATGSWDGTARLWDLNAEDPSQNSVTLAGHKQRVSQVAFSSDNRWLATGSLDRTARLWRLTARQQITNSIILTGHESDILCMGLSPDNRWLATGSFDRTVRLWDITASDPSAKSVVLRGHEGAVDVLAFSQGSRRLATSSHQDQTVRLWDLNAHDLSRKAPIILYSKVGAIKELQITEDWLVGIGDSVQIWPMKMDELLRRAERAIGRNFSASEWIRYFPNEVYRKTCVHLPENQQ